MKISLPGLVLFYDYCFKKCIMYVFQRYIIPRFLHNSVKIVMRFLQMFKITRNYKS